MFQVISSTEKIASHSITFNGYSETLHPFRNCEITQAHIKSALHKQRKCSYSKIVARLRQLTTLPFVSHNIIYTFSRGLYTETIAHRRRKANG